MKRKKVYGCLLSVTKEWSPTFKNKHIRKSIVNKYRQGTVKSIQYEEGERDLEFGYLKALGAYKK